MKKTLTSSVSSLWEVSSEKKSTCARTFNYAMVSSGKDSTINLEVQEDFGNVYDCQVASYSFTIDEWREFVAEVEKHLPKP